MLKHRYNTRTQYECQWINDNGVVACTFWFQVRNPTFSRMYRVFRDNIDFIREKCGAHDVEINDGVFSCGGFIAKMTGKTLLESRGYDEKSYQ